MELLALVLFLLNTANFHLREQADWKFTPNWVWTILCLLEIRSLGGNLTERRVTDGFTPFLFNLKNNEYKKEFIDSFRKSILIQLQNTATTNNTICDDKRE